MKIVAKLVFPPESNSPGGNTVAMIAIISTPSTEVSSRMITSAESCSPDTDPAGNVKVVTKPM